MEFVGPREEDKRDDSHLATGIKYGSDPFGNIFVIHVLRNRYKTTAVRPMTNAVSSLLSSLITVSHPFEAIIVPLY